MPKGHHPTDALASLHVLLREAYPPFSGEASQAAPAYGGAYGGKPKKGEPAYRAQALNDAAWGRDGPRIGKRQASQYFHGVQVGLLWTRVYLGDLISTRRRSGGEAVRDSSGVNWDVYLAPCGGKVPTESTYSGFSPYNFCQNWNGTALSYSRPGARKHSH